jgi:hypothetical protein
MKTLSIEHVANGAWWRTLYAAAGRESADRLRLIRA